jgi:hypothetical protein
VGTGEWLRGRERLRGRRVKASQPGLRQATASSSHIAESAFEQFVYPIIVGNDVRQIVYFSEGEVC